VGTREPDPNLQITGEYAVRAGASQAINLRVQIGGTLIAPRISLDSDAQPPLSQSDLLSYLAFGTTSARCCSSRARRWPAAAGRTTSPARGAQSRPNSWRRSRSGCSWTSSRAGRASLGAAYVNVTPADLYTELAQSGEISGFSKGTEIEVGKYTDPNTFVALQARLSAFASNPNDRAVPGIRVVRRMGKGFSVDASYTPRYVTQPSTLEQVHARSTGSSEPS
jgi:hypothetical protein